MEIRRKLVMRMMMLGARERAVRRRRSWREKATSWPDSGFLMVRSMKGIPGFSGAGGIVTVPSVDIPGKGGTWAAGGGPPRRINRQNRARNGAGFLMI
jgi:hypothetical protein